MNKKLITAAIISILIIGSAVGFFIWKNKPAREFLKNAGRGAQTLTDSATKGVLPSLDTNVLENKPDLNPVDKTNPYKDIKINPFEN